MEILKNPNYDFIGKTKYFLALSLIFIGSGLAVMLGRGVKYGVEFSGGTQVIAGFQSPPQVDRVRTAVDKDKTGAVIQSYGDPKRNQVLIRLAGETETAAEGELDATAKKLLAALASNYPENPVLESSSEIVGPIVGAELRRKAVILTGLGLLLQLVYIAARFKGGVWGAAAAVAGMHDLLICLGFLTFFGYEITLNVIAALLTLVGYSVNDTIVVFDRVRENLKQRRKDPIRKILNDSVNQTLTRTLISNGTTFLAVLGLYLFGGEVLAGFGFTMVVGILVGTYSTIYIAVPLVVFWSERNQPSKTPSAAVSSRAAL
ncbi:MAG TPA: protein translocase subunit SecF [Vicinamibacteria bacterium]|nr:protein translocase subunit SecF [Vicinamibacteria bacterium]